MSSTIIRSIGTNAIQHFLVRSFLVRGHRDYITCSHKEEETVRKAYVITLGAFVLLFGYGLIALAVYLLTWKLLVILAATMSYFFLGRDKRVSVKTSQRLTLEENLAGWHTSEGLGVSALLPPVHRANVIPFPTTYKVIPTYEAEQVLFSSTYRVINPKETACSN